MATRVLPSISPRAWIRWQLPYVAFCYAYFPVTLTKRVLLRPKRAYFGLDPLAVRFWNKWGFLSKALRARFQGANPVWINMNSGGEVTMSWALLRRLGAGNADYLLSTESYDSFDILRRNYDPAQVMFPPWDTAFPVRRVLDTVAPRGLVFTENAYFPVLVREARRRGIPAVLVSALMTRNVAVGNKVMHRALALRSYHSLQAIGAKTEEDYRAFRQMGIPAERLEVTGNTKADLRFLRLSAEERERLRQTLRLGRDDRVLVVGSVHPAEVEAILEAHAQLIQAVPGARLALAPRWLHEIPQFVPSIEQRGWRVALWSDVLAGVDAGPYDVLVIDTFGELGRLYGAMDVAFIGSSLVPINDRRGGHNILEPLAHALPTVFGPHMNLWIPETRRLKQTWEGFEIDGPEGLARSAAAIMEGSVGLEEFREVAADIIAAGSGAVDRTVAFIREHLG